MTQDVVVSAKARSGAPKSTSKRHDIPQIIAQADHAIAAAKDPAEVLEVERNLDTFETMMKNSGLYTQDELREINEFKMRARYRLGGLLAKMERGSGPGRGKKNQHLSESFTIYLKRIDLEWNRAQEAQRIATMPKGEFEKVLVANHQAGVLNSIVALVKAARPYWYKASRKKRHQTINATAAATKIDAPIGPFPLIYADPPWRFKIYSEKGLERTPDQHYETLTDEEIMNFKIGDKNISEIAHKDAALLMWCTSSNLHRALEIMKAWGFEFKTSAAWDKEVTGLGLVFRNQHELLLYGTRGSMPGPQYQPPSLFRYRRTEHSAKPPEIRAEIEKMYPDFDASQRLELFANYTEMPGWTPWGKPHYDANKKDDAE